MFKRMIEGDKIYSSRPDAEKGFRQNEKSAQETFEASRRQQGRKLQQEDGMYQYNHFVTWLTQSPSSAPSAAEVDAAHQATGVPSLGAESVNRMNGPR